LWLVSTIRTHIASRFFTIFIGAVFMNMSFFLSEVRLLKLDLNRDMAENIVKLISGAGFEEERESGEESMAGEGKVVDMFLSLALAPPLVSGTFLSQSKLHADDGSLSPGCVEITTPPPKV
jgi:hypothetical protein